MRLLFLLSLLLPALAAAEPKGGDVPRGADASKGAGGPKGGRTCRIIFPGAPEGAPGKLHLHDGTTSQAVELPGMNLSPVYHVASGPLVLRLLPAPPAEGAEIAAAAPQAAIGESVTDFFLLVLPDPANPVTPVKLQVIDAAAAHFKPGQMLWFNLSPNALKGKVGSQELALEPDARTTLGPPAEKPGDYPVSIAYRREGNEDLYPLCEATWLHDPAVRTLFVVLSQPGTRVPRVVGFPDDRKAAATPKRKR